MKNLLIFILLLAGGFYYFHDKQETADLAKIQAENEALNQQLLDAQASINGLRLRAQQQVQQQPVFQPSASPLFPARRPGSTTQTMDPDDLNRPAYH